MPADPRQPASRSLLRRMTRPFTRPLDGRIADINRRVTDAHLSVTQQSTTLDAKLADLKGELDAYVATAAESNTYVGLQLRRFEEALQALSDDADVREARFEERIDSLGHAGYVERLTHAADAPLERLDGAAANLINHASGHRGFAAQAGLWFNPSVTVELGEGRARLATVNERVVEIPFAMSALGRLQPQARILDIGAAESTFSLSAASLGYRVTALDLHPLPYSHPNLESIAGRFEDWDPGATRFDAVFLISTIEHVGIGAYGEPADISDADRALLARVRKELLRDGGFLVLTTPYGPAQQNALERTYDDAALAQLLAGWTLLERRIARRQDEHTWVATDDALDAPPDDALGVVMVLATPDHRS
jgi:hypothetical protein